MSEETKIKIEVMRYNPEENDKPYLQTFSIPYDNSMSLLEALNYIKENLAPDLSYRWSCRMAVCGSCSIMANGFPSLACKTFLRDFPSGVRIEALANFGVERDLVVGLGKFVKSIEAIKPYIINNPNANSEQPSKQTPAQLDKYRQFSMCINCGLCYAACPNFGINPEFIGPAALTLAHRYNLDSRDRGKKERMKVIDSENGVWNCSFVGYCSEVCPKHVDPAGAVQQTKVETAKSFLLSFIGK